VIDLLTNPKRADEFRKSSKKRLDQEFTRESMLNSLSNLYWETAVKRSPNM